MAYKIIPLIPNNQVLTVTLPVDGKNLTLTLSFNYNTIAGYWYMSVTDTKSNTMMLGGIPLVTGDFPAANLIEQYSYLSIGSAFVVATNSLAMDIPKETNLGTDYVLVWGDTFD